MTDRIPRFEMWALHEKVGKQPWTLAQWFSPMYRTEEQVKELAKSMGLPRVKYKAVKYVPSWRT